MLWSEEPAAPEPPVTEKTVLACPTYSCGDLQASTCICMRHIKEIWNGKTARVFIQPWIFLTPWLQGFQCTRGRRVVKFELEKTEFALFPSLIHQDGFSMHMYGGRESLQRDCHGHYFFSANVKRADDQEDLQAKFMGLERKHNFQGYLMKFTPGLI